MPEIYESPLTEEERILIQRQNQVAENIETREIAKSWLSYYLKSNRLPPLDKKYGIPSQQLALYASLEFGEEPKQLGIILQNWGNLEATFSEFERKKDKNRFLDLVVYTALNHFILN